MAIPSPGRCVYAGSSLISKELSHETELAERNTTMSLQEDKVPLVEDVQVLLCCAYSHGVRFKALLEADG